MSESMTWWWARKLVRYCSSASSRSWSSIWIMASFLSTDLSWFWLRTSMSFLRPSTLAFLMIWRHFSLIFLLFKTA